jgi:hypothetical protein
MSNEIKFDASSMTWTQVAQNKRREIKGQRSVNLPLLDAGDSSYAAVESFAEFVKESGGDIEVSVLSALDDLQQIAKNWIAKVDKGGSEADIKLAGSQLKPVIELYKAVESYYVANYEIAAAGD